MNEAVRVCWTEDLWMDDDDEREGEDQTYIADLDGE